MKISDLRNLKLIPGKGWSKNKPTVKTPFHRHCMEVARSCLSNIAFQVINMANWPISFIFFNLVRRPKDKIVDSALE